MNKQSKTLTSLVVASLASVSLATASMNMAWAAETHNQSSQKVAATTAKNHSNAEKSSATENGKELVKRNSQLVKEAVAANKDILTAIEQLQKHKKDDAYKTLADAAGKLDIVLARDPHLLLAPIDVRSHTITLAMKPDEIKHAVKLAKTELDAGHIQTVRNILKPLSSEIRFSTDYLPMGSYPAAIRAAAAKVQKGDLKGAEGDLYGVLSTIVTTEEAIPLPPIIAKADVYEAEHIVKESKDKDKAKNKTQNQDLAMTLLQKADKQLELSSLLGYGNFKDVKKEIASVESRIKNNSSDTHLFGKLKHLLEEVRNKV